MRTVKTEGVTGDGYPVVRDTVVHTEYVVAWFEPFTMGQSARGFGRIWDAARNAALPKARGWDASEELALTRDGRWAWPSVARADRAS